MKCVLKRVAILSLLLAIPTFADEKPTPQGVPELAPKVRNQETMVIKLKHVAPTTMLQWLDL